jgi:hypothetical protein
MSYLLFLGPIGIGPQALKLPLRKKNMNKKGLPLGKNMVIYAIFPTYIYFG